MPFRYTKILSYSSTDSENTPFPILEVKAFIFSYNPLRIREPQLNLMINNIKKHYDYKDFFAFPIKRRVTAYESEKIAEEEFKEERKFVTVTVWDEEETIRNGFPKTFDID